MVVDVREVEVDVEVEVEEVAPGAEVDVVLVVEVLVDDVEDVEVDEVEVVEVVEATAPVDSKAPLSGAVPSNARAMPASVTTPLHARSTVIWGVEEPAAVSETMRARAALPKSATLFVQVAPVIWMTSPCAPR